MTRTKIWLFISCFTVSRNIVIYIFKTDGEIVRCLVSVGLVLKKPSKSKYNAKPSTFVKSSRGVLVIVPFVILKDSVSF